MVVLIFFNEQVNMLKDLVCLQVSALSIPLSFNETNVISVDKEVCWLSNNAEE